MISGFLQKAVSAVPWRMRSKIKNVPLIAPLQRWLVRRFLADKEFVHRVDAGPARGLVYPVRLPQEKGIWTGTYETKFATALASEVAAGGVCFDIGGWHGFYSGVMALAGAAKVFVFEPLPANCERIRRLIQLNSSLPIELIEAAVADRTGTTQFEVMNQESMGKLTDSPFQREKSCGERMSVQVVALDELLTNGRISAPSLLKIDVEGGELLVLRGAARLLREHRPVLFMELHSPELARDCRNLLESLGYHVQLLEEDGPVDPAVCHFRAAPADHPAQTARIRNAITPPRAFDIPILLYHHLVAGDEVDPTAYEISLHQFEEQLDTLQRLKFETIDFATLTEILEGRQKPRKPIAIVTFDDAFRSFFELALPALTRRRMRATVFVPAGEIGGSNRWDSAKGFPRREIMSEDELRQIATEGMEIGSHGWAHRSLPECSEADAQEELVRSREHLRALGLSADVFAYPYGAYSRRSAEMVKEAGYDAAVSIFSDALSVTQDRYAMRRIYVHPGDTPWRFRCKLGKAYLRYKALRDGWQKAATL